jgi:hypothetical protein
LVYIPLSDIRRLRNNADNTKIGFIMQLFPPFYNFLLLSSRCCHSGLTFTMQFHLSVLATCGSTNTCPTSEFNVNIAHFCVVVFSPSC